MRSSHEKFSLPVEFKWPRLETPKDPEMEEG